MSTDVQLAFKAWLQDFEALVVNRVAIVGLHEFSIEMIRALDETQLRVNTSRICAHAVVFHTMCWYHSRRLLSKHE